MRVVQSQSDFVGYKHQFARVVRMLNRIYQPPSDERTFQDDVFSFFMHCYHLADWVECDPLAPSASKRKVRQKLSKSTLFPICRDIANGSKHLHLSDPKSGAGARYSHFEMIEWPVTGRMTYDVVFDDGTGRPVSGLQLALRCFNEWRMILKAARLPVELYRGPDSLSSAPLRTTSRPRKR